MFPYFSQEMSVRFKNDSIKVRIYWTGPRISSLPDSSQQVACTASEYTAAPIFLSLSSDIQRYNALFNCCV